MYLFISHSQSTEDSLDVKETLYSQEPIYDKPFTHHHPSDSEHEWPHSTTPPPRPTSPPNGELPSRDQLVKPSMLRKNRGSNAGNCFIHYCSTPEVYLKCPWVKAFYNFSYAFFLCISWLVLYVTIKL